MDTLRVLDSAFEDVLGEIPFRGVWNHGHNPFAPAEALRHLNRSKDVCARARAAEHTLFAREVANGVKCVLIGDHNDFIARVAIEGLRNKADANPLYLMLTRSTALEHGALCLDGHRVDAWVLLLHKSGNPGKCSSGSDSDRDCMDVPLHLLVDFRRRSFIMKLWIRRIL